MSYDRSEQAIARLVALEAEANDGRGISCVRSILIYIGARKPAYSDTFLSPNWESANSVAELEGDKIRSYPEIEKQLINMGLNTNRWCMKCLVFHEHVVENNKIVCKRDPEYPTW